MVQIDQACADKDPNSQNLIFLKTDEPSVVQTMIPRSTVLAQQKVSHAVFVDQRLAGWLVDSGKRARTSLSASAPYPEAAAAGGCTHSLPLIISQHLSVQKGQKKGVTPAFLTF